MIPRHRTQPPSWVAVSGVEDGMGYAFAVGQNAPLIVVPVSVRNNSVTPVTEDGKALFDQAGIRAWWMGTIDGGAQPGFYVMPLIPVLGDVRQHLTEWPRRYGGILWYRTADELRDALKEMRVWADRIGSDVDRVVVSLRGTVPMAEIRSVLDRHLDARFLIVID
jgi:hypothetical protein